MAPFEKPNAELPNFLRFVPRPPGDWIDMEFVLQEIEQEFRGEVLALRPRVLKRHRSSTIGEATRSR